LRFSEIIDNSNSAADEVSLGRKVTFVELPDGDVEEYTIVGSAEADPFSGRISNDSPIAKALIGKKIGDEVVISTPGGDMTIKISSIE
ncbi:GreA/GreB family elongation factor, partial [Carnobacterium sp.]|uniref:GreA/GreB family elongation factor n=1 Tax=Carnobacterium sp. TaxID=48221 RepID=UPI0028AD2A57